MRFIYILISLIVFSLTDCLSGDHPILLGTIDGSSSVTVGTTITYTYESGVTIYDPYWNAGSLGVIQSHWVSDARYYVSVTWTTTGTSTLRFYEDGGMTQLASKNITIAGLSAPSTSVTSALNCGNTVVTRSTSPPSGAGYDWWWQTSSSGTSTALGSGSSVTITTASSLYLRARTKVSPYSWSSAQSFGSFSVSAAAPTAPVSATHSYTISNTIVSTNITVASVTGATSYAWYDQPSGGTAVAGVTGTSYNPLLSQTKTYYVASKRDGCESTTRTAVTAYLYSEPVITATNHGNVVLNSPVTLSVSNAIYDSYQWIDNDGHNIPGATNSTYSTNTPGNYRLRVTKSAAQPFITLVYVIGTGLTGQDMNYVTERNILKPEVYSGESSLPLTAVRETIEYFDGMGRTLQTVMTQQSPLQRDVVLPMVYDSYGRESEKYLPYVSYDNNGWYKSDALNSAKQFYTSSGDDVVDDSMPHSNTIFETSPLNRVVKEGAPGQVWQASTAGSDDHSHKNTYLLNKENEVLLFSYDATIQTIPINTLTYYPAAQLYVNKTTNEHNHEVILYVDKDGKTILKRVEYKEEAGVKLYAETYYIYDVYGNLVMVLPPEAVSAIKSNQQN